MSINNKYTSIEQIVAKIDNDFNPDNSDWIPRVAAWCIDALQQLRLFNKVDKKLKLKVTDRIARTCCNLDVTDIKVYDEDGCEIKKAEIGDVWNECCNSFTGVGEKSETEEPAYTEVTDTIGLQQGESAGSDTSYMRTIQTKDYNARYNAIYDVEYNNKNNKSNHRYVLANCNTIEINFDAKYIIVVYKTVQTIKSDKYGIELPTIPNNGTVIEALTNYCMYKMLCRGYKHPVFNLQASQYGTNPYYIWMQLKDKAKTESILDSQSESDVDDSSRMFRSNFYIDGFDPRR